MHSGLPVGVAAFIGRERERTELAELLSRSRVVTLTGSGGCGKTRLAAAVAGDVSSRFTDGVRWVDLQVLRDPELVPRAVGDATGVRERPGRDLTDTLAARLQKRRLLLALDNCEHLVEACAHLVGTLVGTCPELQVLATSRVPLLVDGETTFELTGLATPEADASTARAVAGSDAGRLFEVRARHVVAAFRIDQDNATAVADICRRLDGNPLAIELAAARTRVLAPDQIAAALSDRFALLTGGLRSAPARQRTLQASLDWSWDLLDDAERLALARLSVFVGSFELDAAQAVVAGDDLGEDRVLDLVAALVEQSMVHVVPRGRIVRYRLLETVRDYGRQRLAELDDPARVRDRHLAFHIGLARRARQGLHGARPEPWVTRLGDELADLRAAMERAGVAGDLRGLIEITEPIVRYWLEHGLSREVHQRLREAAGAAGAVGADRVRALNTAAALALGTYEPAAFHESAVLAVDAARDVGDDGPLALALAHRALSATLSGRASSSEVGADVDEAIRLARDGAHAATRAHVLQFSGAALLHSRSIGAGYELYRRCVAVCESEGLPFHLPAAHGGAQAWLPWSGRLGSTRHHAGRAITLSRRLGRPGWEAAGLTGLAACHVLRGEHSEARRRLSQARTALEPSGLEATHYGMWARHWRALAAYAAGDLIEAEAVAAEIVRIARAGGSRLDEAVGEWLLGDVARAQDRTGEARAHLEASRWLSADPQLPHTLGRSTLGLAELAVRVDDLDEAVALAHESLEVLDRYGDRVGTARALETVAEVAVAVDEPERAVRLLAASQRFHDDTGIARVPVSAERHVRIRHAVHEALGPRVDVRSWQAGYALPLADAVAYARRGRGERRRPPTGWLSLTPTERDVVLLVADGLTNAEIGHRLFVSVNTVKKHLTNVYAKLDVHGRTDLAAQVARRVGVTRRGADDYPVG